MAPGGMAPGGTAPGGGAARACAASMGSWTPATGVLPSQAIKRRLFALPSRRPTCFPRIFLFFLAPARAAFRMVLRPTLGDSDPQVGAVPPPEDVRSDVMFLLQTWDPDMTSDPSRGSAASSFALQGETDHVTLGNARIDPIQPRRPGQPETR